MKKNFFLYIGAGIAVLIIALVLGLDKDVEFVLKSSPELDFQYVSANAKLKENLEIYNISMSTTLEFGKPDLIAKYCSFFDDKNKQKLVEYCTSTELRDSEGNFLGNIHMVGSPRLPKLVLVLIQADPFVKELPEIK